MAGAKLEMHSYSCGYVKRRLHGHIAVEINV